MKPNYISKQAGKSLPDDKESLYSLRHSFINTLADRDVRAEIISELAGHTHQGMTMGRYNKGFKTEILYEAICKL